MLYVIDRARIALLLPYCFYYGADQFCVAMYMLFCSFFSFVRVSVYRFKAISIDADLHRLIAVWLRRCSWHRRQGCAHLVIKECGRSVRISASCLPGCYGADVAGSICLRSRVLYLRDADSDFRARHQRRLSRCLVELFAHSRVVVVVVVVVVFSFILTSSDAT